MSIEEVFILLLCILLTQTSFIPLINMNSTFDENSSFINLSNENSSIITTENEEIIVTEPETVFDNNYSVELSPISTNISEEFHAGPRYEANWTFIDKEKLRVMFCLFSLSRITTNKNFSDKIHESKKQVLYTTMSSLSSHSNKSLSSLKYYLFTIRQYKTNMEKILPMDQLTLRSSSDTEQYYSNALTIERLNPKEKYSVCIYYYQINSTSQIADLSICIDIMHDHSKHSVHGLLFVLTQYSIILGLLIALQGLFSMRKRHVAHIIHQHFLNKTQRIRSTFSSVSLVRQSFSSTNITSEQQQQQSTNESNLKKRIISSPAIVITNPSTSSSKSSFQQVDEHEPFIKMTVNKNHVHFFCDVEEESNDEDENDTVFVPPHHEPYSDQPHALLSMTHILDTNKPWSTNNTILQIK